MMVKLVKFAIPVIFSALLLSGCSYDYWQHTDRVGYSAGDAVRANLEGQTTDPSNDDQYDTTGLGKDGNVSTPDE